MKVLSVLTKKTHLSITSRRQGGQISWHDLSIFFAPIFAKFRRNRLRSVRLSFTRNALFLSSKIFAKVRVWWKLSKKCPVIVKTSFLCHRRHFKTVDLSIDEHNDVFALPRFFWAVLVSGKRQTLTTFRFQFLFFWRKFEQIEEEFDAFGWFGVSKINKLFTFLGGSDFNLSATTRVEERVGKDKNLGPIYTCNFKLRFRIKYKLRW